MVQRVIVDSLEAYIPSSPHQVIVEGQSKLIRTNSNHCVFEMVVMRMSTIRSDASSVTGRKLAVV